MDTAVSSRVRNICLLRCLLCFLYSHLLAGTALKTVTWSGPRCRSREYEIYIFLVFLKFFLLCFLLGNTIGRKNKIYICFGFWEFVFNNRVSLYNWLVLTLALHFMIENKQLLGVWYIYTSHSTQHFCWLFRRELLFRRMIYQGLPIVITSLSIKIHFYQL